LAARGRQTKKSSLMPKHTTRSPIAMMRNLESIPEGARVYDPIAVSRLRG